MPPQLPTHKLGKHGPDVTALGFGMMGLSLFYGTPKPTEERLALLDHVYESGVLLWDTADMYGDNEDLIGEWFRRNPGKRENIFLATKFGNFVDPVTGARSIRNEPEYIHEALDKSLKRLGTDYVDLYYVHRLDKDQPIEITIAELKKLKEAGKIKHIGLSEASADSLRRASGVVHIDALQVEYSPFSLDIESPESGLLRTARELGTAVVAYSPLNRGFLTGAIRSPDDFEDGDFRKGAPRFSRENFHKNLELVGKIEEVAGRKGVTPAQVTLAWLLAQGGDVIPIPGTSRIKNFDENVGALKVRLTQEEKDEIRKAVDDTEVAGARYPEHALGSLYVTTRPLDSA